MRMAPLVNRQVLLRSRLKAHPQTENFEIVETRMPEIDDRQVLVRNEFLSVEPAMRGWMS
jgi:NADPH-dependent curcumin reductase CurA